MTKNRDAEEVRLNRFLATAGFGSRRGVEELIRSGRVKINGHVITNLATQVVPEYDTIEVDGDTASAPRYRRIYAFNKPHGVVSTLKAQLGQPCLLAYREQAHLPERMMPVGRLDAETTGLLLWTDDGDLSQALCRPETGVWKRYEVVLRARMSPEQHRQLTSGTIELDGRPCRPSRIEARKPIDDRHWIIELHEGRKRQIRRMMSAVGLNVLALKRVAFGPIELRKLKEGCFRRLGHAEERVIRKAVKKKK